MRISLPSRNEKKKIETSILWLLLWHKPDHKMQFQIRHMRHIFSIGSYLGRGGDVDVVFGVMPLEGYVFNRVSMFRRLYNQYTRGES